jgi:crotonobetainyl-CoA:carnitine CoA-transferase CaiB-like acyl-CoA transferase
MSHEYPFEGIRVLDASQGIAGPSAAMMLARYGADVVKVEPREGDWSRLIGAGNDGMTSLCVATNLGKRSIALDLKHAEGARVFHRLAERADVFVENFRTGVMDRLGFGYAQVAAFNPRVIYISVTGFGQHGPMQAQPATDVILQAFTGMMGLNRGAEDGLPHRVDCWPIDVITGVYAYQAIATALYARRDSGRGRYIDASLLQGASGLQNVRILDHVASGGAKGVASSFPMGSFRTQDGWINLSVLRDALWPPFCRVIGKPEWATDPGFATAAGRRAHAEVILAHVNATFAGNTCAHWCAALREADILNEAVNTYDQLLAHRQTEANATFAWLEHPGIGRVPHPNLPGPQPLAADAPQARVARVGEHTQEILDELGYSREIARSLIEQSVVFVTPPAP